MSKLHDSECFGEVLLLGVIEKRDPKARAEPKPEELSKSKSSDFALVDEPMKVLK